MPYDNVINRADVSDIVPPEVSFELINTVSKESSHVMRLGRKLRNMTAYEDSMPVLSALATAYFPDGDTGLVDSTEINWEGVSLYAKDIAVLVPIPKNVLSDARVPIWDECKPIMATAAGAAIDKAILYGTNKPAAWPTAIVVAALAASQMVSLASFDDIYDAILGESGVFAKVEVDGFGVSGCIADLSIKGKLRGCRDANGQPVFSKDPAVANQYNLDGAPIFFPENGAGSTTNKLIAGDWQQLVYSIRQDMNFDVFTEGVITDAAGKIVYNLMQQRMAALMLTMRLGFALPNPINWVNSDDVTRYPFAYLTA